MTGPRSTLAGTGHRVIHHPGPMLGALTGLLESGVASFVISGGAGGGDTLIARAAADVGVPFGVLLPNHRYRDRYLDAIDGDLLARAVWVRYAVDRPDVPDWRVRWDTEKWWTDNFKRNTAMAVEAGAAVVMSRPHPLALLRPQRSGVAHCVRTLAGRGYQTVWWVPDRADTTAELVWLTTSPTLPGVV